MELTERWLENLECLKVDRATGDPAPHKPLLLLVVLDLARENALLSGCLRLTPELVFRFSAYWPIVAHRRKRVQTFGSLSIIFSLTVFGLRSAKTGDRRRTIESLRSFR